MLPVYLVVMSLTNQEPKEKKLRFKDPEKESEENSSLMEEENSSLEDKATDYGVSL